VALLVRNKDWENWQNTMHVEPQAPAGSTGANRTPVVRPRPGHADLAGALSVVRVGGFLPAAADSLIILSSNQPITGMFSNVVGGHVTATDGITSLKVSVIGNHLVVGELPGDYNGNGLVDAADYAVWRNGLGDTFTQSHYDIWKANFGKTVAVQAASALAAEAAAGELVLSSKFCWS
jgi:hypothetical protein